MRSTWIRTERAAGHLVCLACCAGCNAVLGIDKPLNAPEDMTAEPALQSDPRAHGDGRQDGGSEEEAPSAHAWAAWPMPNSAANSLPNAQAYEINVEGVVTDRVTQLEWQQAVDDVPRTWEGAKAYCAGLGLAGGGFRLPARIELISLLDFSRAGTSIDHEFFPETPGARFWSASPVAGMRAGAWLIDFHFSTRSVFQADPAEAHRVRCVR